MVAALKCTRLTSMFSTTIFTVVFTIWVNFDWVVLILPVLDSREKQYTHPLHLVPVS